MLNGVTTLSLRSCKVCAQEPLGKGQGKTSFGLELSLAHQDTDRYLEQKSPGRVCNFCSNRPLKKLAFGPMGSFSNY